MILIKSTSCYSKANLTHVEKSKRPLAVLALNIAREYHTFFSFNSWRSFVMLPLQWRHEEKERLKSPAVQLFTQRFIQAQIKETSKLGVPGRCEGNSPVTDKFPAQSASNAENVSIWWRHHGILLYHRLSENCAAHTGHLSVVSPNRCLWEQGSLQKIQRNCYIYTTPLFSLYFTFTRRCKYWDWVKSVAILQMRL